MHKFASIHLFISYFGIPFVVAQIGNVSKLCAHDVTHFTAGDPGIVLPTRFNNF